MVKSSCDVARVCPKRTAIARHAKAPPVVRLSFCQGSLWLERWWRGACLDQLFECEAIASPPYRDFLQVRFRRYHYCRPGCRVSNPHEEGDPSSPTIPTTITRHDWALTWATWNSMQQVKVAGTRFIKGRNLSGRRRYPRDRPEGNDRWRSSGRRGSGFPLAGDEGAEMPADEGHDQHDDGGGHEGDQHQAALPHFPAGGQRHQ